MVDVTLYKPEFIDAVVKIPAEWNELTAQEFLFIAKQLITPYENIVECKTHIAMHLLQSGAAMQKIKLPKNWYNLITDDDASVFALNITQFLFDSLNITVQLVPHIKKLLGPASNFDDITCGEFEDSEIFFHAFKKSNSPEDLVMLNAILWRDRKIAYENYKPEKFRNIFLSTQWHVLYANFLWYSSCRNLLARLFKNFFGGSSEEKEPDTIAFTKCIHAGAGPENGTRKEIRKTLLKEFSLDMELKIIRNKELEDRSKQA